MVLTYAETNYPNFAKALGLFLIIFDYISFVILAVEADAMLVSERSVDLGCTGRMLYDASSS